ncbi:hypothetical protein K1719_033537 [Acacia pycnantha]|nr:hypothetical protein K1719_033537 [Acacia pycnantha]
MSLAIYLAQSKRAKPFMVKLNTFSNFSAGVVLDVGARKIPNMCIMNNISNFSPDSPEVMRWDFTYSLTAAAASSTATAIVTPLSDPLYLLLLPPLFFFLSVTWNITSAH